MAIDFVINSADNTRFGIDTIVNTVQVQSFCLYKSNKKVYFTEATNSDTYIATGEGSKT